jgi:hypothetical protein
MLSISHAVVAVVEVAPVPARVIDAVVKASRLRSCWCPIHVTRGRSLQACAGAVEYTRVAFQRTNFASARLSPGWRSHAVRA